MARLLALFVFCGIVSSQTAPDRWKDLRFLIGEWTAGGGGASTGQGMGAYSFLPELGGTVLVRRNISDYPAANGRPAVHHEDVMTVYIEGEGKPPEAIYFDNEGHVIHYLIETAPTGKEARFVSPAREGEPRYRLIYRETAEGVVVGEFAIAPPGRPESFTKYLDWVSQRKTSK